MVLHSQMMIKRFTLVGLGVGLLAGILYSFGGAAYDLFTTGWNTGTALAFGALLGMPLIFGAAGLGLGITVAAFFKAWHYLK